MNRTYSRLVAIILALCLTLGASVAFAGGGLGTGVYDKPGFEEAPAVAAPAEAASGDVGVAGEQAVLAAGAGKTTKDLVTRMYQVILGREPDAGGLAYWVKGLDEGWLSAADLVIGFAESAEYRASGKTNEQIVTDLYHAMLGRDPDASGLKSWTTTLDIGMTPRTVMAGFVGSQEFLNLAGTYGIYPGYVDLPAAVDQSYELTYFVYRLYQNCLGRKPDAAGQEGWCAALLMGESGTEAAYGFIFSPEYLARHTNNAEYLTMLYSTILGRTVDESGYANWINALNYSQSREKVLNGFLYSREFLAQCQAALIWLGNPIWEPDSTIEWKNNVEVLTLTNKYRALYNVAPLHLREDLYDDVSWVRAFEISDYFSHTRPDGRAWNTAWGDAGMTYTAAGENIAFGYATPQSVVAAWMNSEGHRRNILDSDFDDMATSYYRTKKSVYWAQEFMSTNLK